jgi:sugar lactone lactonase YvrE
MKTLRVLIPLALMLAVSCDDNTPARIAFQGSIETFAGSTFGYEGAGIPATSAKLGYITSVAVDPNGNVYVSDAASNTIRKINTANTISTVAGTFVGFNVVDPHPYAGDGGLAYASHLNVPLAVAVDASGNIYISDTGNNVIRKVDANGEINTIIGTGEQGSSGDNGPALAASIHDPNGIAVDASRNIYFADTDNHTIRKVTTSGQISTIAGTTGQAGYTGDNGDAASAKLDSPNGIAIANDGTIYFSDHNSVIRRISTSGKITTIAGTGEEGYSGDGGKAINAMLLAPKAIAITSDGSLLVADSGNNRIRKIARETGIIETIAGTGEAGHAGDGGQAVNATLSNPQGLAIASNGYIYVAESGSSVIRLIKPAN